MSRGKKILIGVGVVFVLLYAVGRSGSSGTASSTSAAASREEAARAGEEPSAPVERPAKEVSARALFKAYDGNEVSADDTYKGKRVRVSGTVSAIDKDLFDRIIVRLTGGDSYGINTVDATVLPSEKSAAAHLSKRQAVVLVCTVHGKLVGSPQLDDCTIAK
jgi:hypothetical protein